MRIGIFGGAAVEHGIDAVVDAARRTEAEGFASFSIPQIFGLDAITTLAIVGREVPRLELATGVVPTYPRHPTALAAQALTASAASGGRFVLGIGLSHRIVIEAMFGMSFDKPVRHMREYLSILGPLLRGEPVSFQGETLSANVTIAVPGAAPVPLLVAALGPQMLRLAGALADGTVTWMTGAQTLADHIAPSIVAAAAEAGRPAPRIVAALPVCVTDDVAGARARADRLFAIYRDLPSYRAMLDREGASGPADVAIVGSASAVHDQLERLRDAGVSDFVAAEFGDADELSATRAALAEAVGAR